MLQSIRERAQGLAAALIIGLLCLTFVLWGIESYLTSAREVVVAEVNGEKLKLQTYQATFQRLRQRAQAELGDAFDPKIWSEDITKAKALDFLIEDELITQAVERGRLRITDAQVAEYLKSTPTFQVDGKFSRERFAQVASMLGFAERSFEEEARDDMAAQQLRAGVALSAFVTRSAAVRLEQLREQKRTIGYAVIPAADADSIAIAPAEVESYYAEHKEDFRQEERVKLEYLRLTLDDMSAQVPVDDAALQAYYDAHQAQYTTEEQRNVNHVLVQLKKDATLAEDAAARERAGKLRAEVLGGRNIEDVARESSDDLGSKADGGETGLFGKGVMTPEFERAAFALKGLGDVSEVVKTEFGYHVLRLKDIKPGGVMPFDAARADVESAYRREQAENLFFERAEDFSNAVDEHPDSLAAAGEALALTPAMTEALTRTQLAEQFSPALADAVWEPEVLTEGLATPPVELGNTAIVAARVTDRRPSRVPQLDEVRTAIVAALQSGRAREQAAARGQALLDRLRKGEERAAIVSAETLDWKEATAVGRESSEVNRAVLRAAFKAPVPDVGASFVGVGLGTGDFAVIEVSNVQMPAATELDGKALMATKREAERIRMLLAWQDFVATLRAEAKVKTYPQNL